VQHHPKQEKLEKDAELLARARRGDQEAFAELITPLRSRVYWWAVRVLGDVDEAEDVAQETLMRAWFKLDTFRGDARFSSWLHTVANNCIRMQLRARKRRPTTPLDDRFDGLEAPADLAMPGVPASPLAPDVVAEGRQLVERLSSAISRLPPQYGNILRLWVEDGLDLREIRERSGLSIPAIKSRLHRARRRVRDAVAGEAGVGGLLAA